MELTVPVAGGEVWAEDADGDGTPVILVNANWSTAAIWSPLWRLLADRYRLIRYDDRGYGRSPAPAVPFTRLADLRAVVDRVTDRPAVIVGHSGGGGTALGLALSDPGRIAALVLVRDRVPHPPLSARGHSRRRPHAPTPGPGSARGDYRRPACGS
jgi:3-oxoadipate enol-lactonase